MSARSDWQRAESRGALELEHQDAVAEVAKVAARRLTKEQAREARSLVEDCGYSRAEARELVLAGFGEPQPPSDVAARCDAVNRILWADLESKAVGS